METGLREVFKDVDSVTDYSGNLELSFIDYSMNEKPKYDEEECKARDATYAAPLKVRVRLRAYERKIAGYTAPDAILTGLETRTSSPVRLKREEDFVCTQLAGLYPCGEGAGYAGGIMSAAVDGLRVARAIISRYAPAEG